MRKRRLALLISALASSLPGSPGQAMEARMEYPTAAQLRDGRRVLRERASSAIHLLHGVRPGAASLAPFAHAQLMSGEAIYYSAGLGKAWSVVPDGTQVALRESRLGELPDFAPRELKHRAQGVDEAEALPIPLHYARVAIREGLEHLYRDFESKGGALAAKVPQLRLQDQAEQDRTTHFIHYIDWLRMTPYGVQGHAPITHAQALLSRNENEKLHVENEGRKLPRSHANELWAEIGRLDAITLPDIELFGGGGQHTRTELENAKHAYLAYTLRDLHAWLVEDSGVEKAVYQSRKGVYRLLKAIGFPLERGLKLEPIVDVLDEVAVDDRLELEATF